MLLAGGALAQDSRRSGQTLKRVPDRLVQPTRIIRQDQALPSSENMVEPQAATRPAPGRLSDRLATTAMSTTGPLYGLPFKGEDFRDDERVYWHRFKHSDGGVQEHGYDLDVRRYDSQSKTWVANSGSKNEDWYVHGRPVYAMEAGKVIACWRNAPENYKTGTGAGNWHEELTKYDGGKTRIYGGGNGFWIEHADGSRVEYAHFIPGTVPSSLCPHNDALLPVVIDKPWVSKAWPYIRVEPAQQVQVAKGQFLGKAGNSGTSSNPHLHIHREEGGTADTAKSGGSPLRMHYKSGLYVDGVDHTPYDEWKSFAGNPIPPGPILFWPSRSEGTEYARHGYPAGRFGALFQHLADSGYWPEWIDVHNVGGKDFINHVWRPAQGRWLAYYLIDENRYQTAFNDAKQMHFYPVFVESSKSGNQVRYTAVFVENKSGAYRARHGLSYNEHMAEMNAAKNQGLVPVNIAVVSIGANRYYTVLYRSGDIGGWQVKSQIPESGYQAEYNSQSKTGRKPLYLNAYMHQGKPYLSAVFGHVSTSARKDRHGMSSSQYQSEFNSAHGAGLLTRAVTSFDGDQSQHRYAAAWWK